MRRWNAASTGKARQFPFQRDALREAGWATSARPATTFDWRMNVELAKHLFIGEAGGALYDTRLPAWHTQPIRFNYRCTHREIKTVSDLKATLRAGEFAWPGGYPLYFITNDGAALSFKTVRKEFRQVLYSIRNQMSDGWRVCCCEVNYENPELYDDHSGERIESAYAEEKATRRS